MILNAIIKKDDDGYFAEILELKGCVSQGNIYDEALFNIKEAAELYLESRVGWVDLSTQQNKPQDFF